MSDIHNHIDQGDETDVQTLLPSEAMAAMLTDLSGDAAQGLTEQLEGAEQEAHALQVGILQELLTEALELLPASRKELFFKSQAVTDLLFDLEDEEPNTPSVEATIAGALNTLTRMDSQFKLAILKKSGVHVSRENNTYCWGNAQATAEERFLNEADAIDAAWLAVTPVPGSNLIGWP